MKKEHVIRPSDAREYIGFQFEGLATALEQFDYCGVAKVVRATRAVFNHSMPDTHQTINPDCVLLNTEKTQE